MNPSISSVAHITPLIHKFFLNDIASGLLDNLTLIKSISSNLG